MSSTSRPPDVLPGNTGRVHRAWRRLRRFPWLKVLGIGIPTVVVLLVGLGALVYWRTTIPEPSSFSLKTSTTIRYADGTPLATLGTNRQIVDIADIAEPAQKAVLAAEDRGFYTEPGISVKGIARALVTNVRGGGVSQGGSTITQQYAKNAFLTQDRTYTRKVKEVFISLKMTRQRSKAQILQDYLNTIYFGRGAYGIDAASRAYFGPTATAKTLTFAQSAVLASSIRSPSAYDPTKHPELAKARFAYVLDGMVKQGWLDQSTRIATAYPDVIAPTTVGGGSDLTGPLGTVVDRAMQEIADSNTLTEAQVAQGGLDVTLTITKTAEDAAIAAVQTVTADKTGTDLQGALVAVEPRTGKIIAYYGGANGTGIDYADTPEPAGSSFKPYTLATALSQGLSLTTVENGNSPQTFTEADGAKTTITNSSRSEQGPYTLVQATEDSVNTAFYGLALQVGPDNIADLAHRAGIPKSNSLTEGTTGRRTGQITLGAYPVTVQDQATGYATFAAGGTSASSYLVAKVTRGKDTVYEGKTTTQTAYGADVAADATYAMTQVVQSGTGTRAKLAGGRPAAGKTGTTNDNKQVWFAGFTPQLAAAVFYGYGNPQSIKIHGVNEATGGRIAAAAWKVFMDAALTGQPVQQFPARANIGRAVAPPATTTTPPPVTTAPPATTDAPTTTPTPSETVTPTPTTSVSPTQSPTGQPTVSLPPVATAASP